MCVCLSLCSALQWTMQSGWTARDAVWGQTRTGPKNHYMGGAHIGATWRIRCGGGDAVCRYHYCSNLFWILLSYCWMLALLQAWLRAHLPAIIHVVQRVCSIHHHRHWSTGQLSHRYLRAISYLDNYTVSSKNAHFLFFNTSVKN